jgi:hypothetical protein
MNEKEPVYSTYGDSSRFSQATEEREMARIRSYALEALRAIGVQFPVKTKQELVDAIPDDISGHCHYRGRALSLKDLAGNLMDRDFPLHDDIEASILIAAACPVPAGSPEGAPNTNPL